MNMDGGIFAYKKKSIHHDKGRHPYPLCHAYRQMGGWVKHWANKRGKVARLKCKSFVTSLERADKNNGWVKSLSSICR